MTGSPLVLVADDPQLGKAIASYLHENLGQPVCPCGYQGARDLLGPETHNQLVLAWAAPSEAEQVRSLIQEVAIQKLPPVILVVDRSATAATEAAGIGAHVAERLVWPSDADRLVELVRQRLGKSRQFASGGPRTIEDVIRHRLVALTPSLVPLVERIALAAVHDVTVLLTGETGTGKTFLARLMHDCSPRRQQPFLTVPCGAMTPNLIESAFFGHAKGAFTGADRAKIGKFEAAGNGTILLDEIDTLGLEQQASLLRVIETGEFEPVGSNETRRCTARIIVASNWNLEEAVERGKFRQDLYYRLNVMSFHLPPLRERVEDIGPLVRGMVARFNTKFKKDLFDIHTRALEALESFAWPGNIRQMENFVQQAVLLSSGSVLQFENLPQQLRDYRPATPAPATPAPARTQPADDTLVHNRETLERNVIQRALASHGYSRSRAASALGISRVTLYKKMKKYGLMPQSAAESETPTVS